MQITNIVKTMSSREIAELTGKDHRNVTADIKKMLEDLGEDALTFQHIYLDSMVLVAQNCPEFTARIIDRWQELEQQVAAPIELSRLDILRSSPAGLFSD